MRLGVLAYASTDAGYRRAKRHRCKPMVRFFVPCPTVEKEFKGETGIYRTLCEKYDPVPFKPKGILFTEQQSLGYDNTGALIAFAHGAPNNSPNIFHRTGKARPDWTPLFPTRVTAGLPDSEFGAGMSAEAIAERLGRLGEQVLAKSPAAATASVEVKKRLLVLAALTRSNRKTSALAYATGLTIPEADAVSKELVNLGWVDESMRLTDLGNAELRQARQHAQSLKISSSATFPNPAKPRYYPKSLRSPV